MFERILFFILKYKENYRENHRENYREILISVSRFIF